MNRLITRLRPQLRRYSNAIDKLKTMSKSYEIEEKKEVIVVPEGFSETYYLKSTALKDQPLKFDSLLELFRLSTTEQEMTESKEFLRSFLRSNIISRPNTELFVNLLLETNKGLLFELLCNRFKYCVFPTPQHIQKLLELYSLDFMDQKSIEQLDMMYKTFSLLIYYDIPPTLVHYHYLITAGFYSGDAEACKRSLTTVKEVQSLGWDLLPLTKLSLAYYYLQQKELSKVLSLLKDMDTKHALELRIEALVLFDQKEEAKKLLAPYENAVAEDCVFGSKVWKTEDAIKKLVE